VQPPTQSEDRFLGQVLTLAKLLGWRVVHFRPGRTRRGWATPVQGDGLGFPDLLFLRAKTCFVAELKRAGGKPTEAQVEWLEAFRAADIAAYLWTPDAWPEIERVLQEGP
jgi:hypothetical protein